ncbi:L-fuculose-phosphate aldolase [Evansella caseinilytica]|uniref:L-fuculose-phosphate aldolase n=1 Tax=Evansella caseinilytica TaxID=1503961 RepID=A0A1H3RZX7_9BACI|nr:class II aldolase/adducin family protein [Evansella caseinilytica]SDZ31130.1 L-fuculose-phosphate aldolase [Evansella caseinilytica]
MNFKMLHPADQLIMIMERIYGYGMTTTSGGNLSILDENGDVWITPGGIDKGSLTRQDIVRVKPDGTVIGIHKPSSEFPFHKLVYETRPDLKAVVHAHPPALVAFSIVRKIPDTYLLPHFQQICGEVGMAEYALPGSTLLGEKIASVFATGMNAVMLENHGVVVGGTDLFQAFMAFETLEYCARLEIKAKRIGTPVSLTKESVDIPAGQKYNFEKEFTVDYYTSDERAARRDMCQLIHRAYKQKLITSTEGTFSQKISDGSFIITPYGMDRKYLELEDLVKIQDGTAKEAGKVPSRAVTLHQEIYASHPEIKSIVIAHPPSTMAFAVTEEQFDSRTIPESYILLRDIPKLPYGATTQDTKSVAQALGKAVPLVFVKNDCVIVTGGSLLEAFDRLEVVEYSAKAVVSAKAIGEIVQIDEEKIGDLKVAFDLE